MKKIENIRTFHAGRFTVRVDAVEDHDFDPSWMDRDTADDITAGLDSGRYVLFTAHAYVTYDDTLLAEDFRSGCVYTDYAAFMDHVGMRAKSRKKSEETGKCVCYGSSFSDMVRGVVSEARATLRKLSAIRLRHPCGIREY